MTGQAQARPSAPSPSLPHPIALRAFYFFYLASTGVMLPFFSAYLRGLGLSGREVALVLASTPLMHLVTPAFWGWLADRTRRPDIVLRIGVLGASCCYLPLAFARTFAGLFPLYLLSQFFAAPIPGLADTLAVMRVRGAGDRYGRIRATGAPSFLVTCFVAGWLLRERNRAADILTPLSGSVFLLATFGVALWVRGRGPGTRPNLRAALDLLADRRLRFLLSMTALHWACSAPFHGFFAILARDRGLPLTVTSHGFVVSVAAEMVALWNFHRVGARLSLPRLLALVTAVTGVRWLVVATTPSATWLVAIQCLHGFTFGLFWATAIAWVGRLVPDELRATGQTLLTGTTYGLGYLTGLLLTGFIYDATGSAVPAFYGAAAINLAQAPAILLLARRFGPPAEAAARQEAA